MPRQVSAVVKRIGDTIGGFSFAQKTLAILAILVLVLGGVGLSVWLTKPSYAPLFTGLSASDASAITDQLHTDNVSYQLTDGGGTILVPKADVYAERLKAAAAGLPSSTEKGYSLLDTMGVTTSEFDQNVTYKRAMEGELADTIDAMDGVTTASVKLAIPKETVFTDQAEDPTASVFVRRKPGAELSADQVQAIVHLVSASIVDMKPTDVSVIDADGDVLSTVGGGPAGGADTQAATYDTTVQTDVQRMLDKVLGSGNSTVVVNAVMDPSTATKTTKTYTVPKGSPASSSTEQKESYTGDATKTAAGVLGTTTQNAQTTGTQTTGTKTGDGDGAYTSQSTTKDNALDNVTETRQIPAGTLTRQTVSVAVDRAAAASNGVTAKQVNALVSAAAGIDSTRGDAVAVRLVNFSKANATAARKALAEAGRQARQERMLGWAKDGAIALGVVLLALIGGIVVRRRARSRSTELVPAGGPGTANPPEPAVPEFTATPAPPPVPPSDVTSEAVEARRRRAEIEAMAEKDPRRAAEFLRGLMDDRSVS